jgi:transposase
MNELGDTLAHWQLDVGQVRRRMYGAATPRERERWHALWLLARGWSAAQVAEALDRDPHTIGDWLAAFRHAGPAGLSFEQSGGSPPLSTRRNRPR